MSDRQISTPQKTRSVELIKVLEKIQDTELKQRIREIVKNHSREAYLNKLKRCGVIINS